MNYSINSDYVKINTEVDIMYKEISKELLTFLKNSPTAFHSVEMMKDENGNLIYDSNSKTPMSYIQYYDKYCKNVGDLLLGFIETTYPQLSNYTNEQLNILQNSDEVKTLVSQTINNTDILSVQKINNHLLDDITTENILKLHTQKSELNIQLQNIQNNKST